MTDRPVPADAGPAGSSLTPGMEFHLFLPQMRLDPGALVARAQAAESAGFDGMVLMDHLAPPAAVDQPLYEAFTTATWLAARTERLRLGHLVLCDSFRHPSVLARQAVTLDHLSGGRFELGIGSGSTPAELAAFGIEAPDAAGRIARLAETLELLAAFWTGEPVHHEGRFFRVDGVRQRPTPLGSIPVVLGGTGPTTLGLVARHADWWNVPMHQVDRLAEGRQRIGTARVSVQVLVTLITDESRRDEITGTAQRRFGRMGEGGHLTGNGPELVDALARLHRDGVERIYPWFTDFAPPETLAVFGREVIAAFR